MYELWGLPENICDTNPINRSNLNNLIGRDTQVQRLIKALRTKAVIVLEEDIGVGKTSLGNYVRFQKEFFSPSFEVKSNVK